MTQPRIVLTLLARDEQDIVHHNVDFHLSVGVDFVIATDNRSVDATTELLRGYERAGHLHLIEESGEDFAQGRWVTRMARMAAMEYGADWVINTDADEFWWPVDGDLPSVLGAVPEDADAVVAQRHHFPPVDGGAEPFYERMIYRTGEPTNQLGGSLPPKVCHRGMPEVEVHQGIHRVSVPGAGEVNTVDGRGLMEVLHFPIRSYGQYEQKIIHGGRGYQRNTELPERVGRVKRRLYERWEAGQLPEVFEQQLVVPATATARLRSGELRWDGRLRSWLRILQRSGLAKARRSGELVAEH